LIILQELNFFFATGKKANIDIISKMKFFIFLIFQMVRKIKNLEKYSNGN